MRLTGEQWVLISGFLAGVASVIAGYDHWADLGKPAVVAGILVQTAAMLRGLYTQTTDERKEP